MKDIVCYKMKFCLCFALFLHCVCEWNISGWVWSSQFCAPKTRWV